MMAVKLAARRPDGTVRHHEPGSRPSHPGHIVCSADLRADRILGQRSIQGAGLLYSRTAGPIYNCCFYKLGDTGVNRVPDGGVAVDAQGNTWFATTTQSGVFGANNGIEQRMARRRWGVGEAGSTWRTARLFLFGRHATDAARA